MKLGSQIYSISHYSSPVCLTSKVVVVHGKAKRCFGNTHLISVNQAMNGWSYLQSVHCLCSPFDTLTRQQDKTRQQQDNLNPKTSHAAENYIKDSTRRSWRGFQATHGSITQFLLRYCATVHSTRVFLIFFVPHYPISFKSVRSNQVRQDPKTSGLYKPNIRSDQIGFDLRSRSDEKGSSMIQVRCLKILVF